VDDTATVSDVVGTPHLSHLLTFASIILFLHGLLLT